MMEPDKFVHKCVNIREDQENFLREERMFKLSRFVQAKLDEYMKMRREYKQFMSIEKEVK